MPQPARSIIMDLFSSYLARNHISSIHSPSSSHQSPSQPNSTCPSPQLSPPVTLSPIREIDTNLPPIHSPPLRRSPLYQSLPRDTHIDRKGHTISSRAGLKRKQKYQRTRTGCLCCRRRRIKCDEAKPVCQRCIKAKKETQCEYEHPTYTSSIRVFALSSTPLSPNLSTRRSSYPTLTIPPLRLPKLECPALSPEPQAIRPVSLKYQHPWICSNDAFDRQDETELCDASRVYRDAKQVQTSDVFTFRDLR